MDSVYTEAHARAPSRTASSSWTRSTRWPGKASGHGPDVSREGVQRDILPIVEGCTVATKYGPVKTDHILFIAAGAFHVSRVSDLIPELQGRFPVHVELKPLTIDDYKRILTQPQNALIRQYEALLAVDGVELELQGGRAGRHRRARLATPTSTARTSARAGCTQSLRRCSATSPSTRAAATVRRSR